MDQGARAGRGAVERPVGERPIAPLRRAGTHRATHRLNRSRRLAAPLTAGIIALLAALTLGVGPAAAAPGSAPAPVTSTPPTRASAPATSTPSGRPTAAPSAAGSSPSPRQVGIAPDPAPTSAQPVPPTIDDQGAITSATGRFGGTGTPGDTVRVADPATPTSSTCTAIVGADGRWTCSGAVRSGPGQVFTVLDTTHDELPSDDAAPVDVLVPPAITTTGPTTGGVTGTGFPGAQVTVTVVDGAPGASRTATVAADGSWYVSWSADPGPLATGTWPMTATQTAGPTVGYATTVRSASAPVASVVVDRTPPPAPVVSRPAPGAVVRTQPITVAGAGEDGDTVTVYVDGNPVCQSTVTDDRWSCTTAGSSIPDGARVFQAGQRDPAGNLSPVSARRSVTVGGAFTDTTGGSATASSSPSGAAGVPPSGPETSGPAAPGLPGDHATDGAGTGAPGAGGPGAGGPGGSGAGSGPAGTGTGSGSSTGGATGAEGGARADAGWSVATAYDADVPSIGASVSVRTLVLAVVGVVAFLALVAVPLTVLARSVRGRVRWRTARLTGRNRSIGSKPEEPLPAWAAVALSIAIASVLTLLATGVAAEARYARLAIAVVLGTTMLAAATLAAAHLTARPARHVVVVRLSPALVVAALLACLVSRSAHLAPAVVLGVLVVPVVGPAARHAGQHRPDEGARASSATAQVVALLALAATGWVLHSVTGGAGFWHHVASEWATTLCVGGLGSVVTTLLPVAGSAGAALWAASRRRYLALATVGVALAAAVYSGRAGTHLSLGTLAVCMGGCAAVALATWTWVRLVEPALRD